MAFTRLHSRPTRLVGATSLVGGAVAVALAILGPATAAFACGTDNPGPATCTPHDAWTENVPAHGDPTIPNPHYVPAVPAHTDGVVKWSWNGSKTDGTPVFDASSTLWQMTNDHNPNSKDDTSGTVYQQGNGQNASWFSWQPVIVPGTPAQGEPTIPNPAYVPASTINHAAVTCATPTTPAPDPTTTTPAPDPTTTTPAPDPTTTTPAPDPTTTTPAPDPTTSAVTAVLADDTAVDPPAALAQTGSNDVQPLLLAGLGLIAVGGIVLMEARRPRRNRG